LVAAHSQSKLDRRTTPVGHDRVRRSTRDPVIRTVVPGGEHRFCRRRGLRRPWPVAAAVTKVRRRASPTSPIDHRRPDPTGRGPSAQLGTGSRTRTTFDPRRQQTGVGRLERRHVGDVDRATSTSRSSVLPAGRRGAHRGPRRVLTSD
jgi:hypothetical protein